MAARPTAGSARSSRLRSTDKSSVNSVSEAGGFPPGPEGISGGVSISAARAGLASPSSRSRDCSRASASRVVPPGASAPPAVAVIDWLWSRISTATKRLPPQLSLRSNIHSATPIANSASSRHRISMSSQL